MTVTSRWVDERRRVRALPTRGRPRGLFAVALLVFSIGLTGPASAAVTSSNITTPSDPYFDFYDSTSLDPQVFTVAGTTNGTGGDLVDVRCYYDGIWQLLADNVAVAADGTFSTEADKTSPRTCLLRAVPDGGPPNGLFNYTGPRVGFGEAYDYEGSGGELLSHYTAMSTLFAGNEIYAAGDGGLYDSWLYDAKFDNDYEGNWSENASLYNTNFFWPAANVRLDGHNAYTPSDVWYINDAASGVPELGLQRSFDPLTGQWTIIETNPLVFCSADGSSINDVANYPLAGDCPHFIPAGASLVRTITQSHGGQVVRFSDDWMSTDGAEHALQVWYNEELEGTTTMFPGESNYSEHPPGTIIDLSSIPVGTMYTQTDESMPPGFDNIQGAMTWLTSPTRAIFEASWSFVLQFDRTLPSSGSTNITTIHSDALSVEQVRSFAQGAEDGTEAPAVAISSPANGAVLTSDAATVVGTATDNIGVDSLSVNGIPTTVNPDGSWSQRVPLAAGANTITAIAEDASGNTGQAQISVTYSPAGTPSCTVPNVVGQTQAAASGALTAAGCSVGDISAAASRTIAKGSVVRQGNPAGQRVSAFYPVPLVISSGPVGRASLVSKTLRLKGRRISMQVRCPSTAGGACNGTIKLRTNRLGGARRTLGTKSFQAPAGGRRRTSLTVSRANARRIHRADRVRGLAFIVYRDEDGKARTTRTRILIRG